MVHRWSGAWRVWGFGGLRCLGLWWLGICWVGVLGGWWSEVWIAWGVFGFAVWGRLGLDIWWFGVDGVWGLVIWSVWERLVIWGEPLKRALRVLKGGPSGGERGIG